MKIILVAPSLCNDTISRTSQNIEDMHTTKQDKKERTCNRPAVIYWSHMGNHLIILAIWCDAQIFSVFLSQKVSLPLLTLSYSSRK